MKRPGLTEAMRRALENPGAASRPMREKLHALGLLDEAHWYTAKLTPRGQAARAAPRVTAAEYEGLCEAQKGWTPTPARMRNRLHSLGWIVGLGIYASHLTPAGTTALNNIRAASGSPEWKP